MTMKKNEIIDEVYSEEIMKALLNDMQEDEKAKLDAVLDAFITNVTIPLIDVFESLLKDDDVTKELKKQLVKSHKVVVSK